MLKVVETFSGIGAQAKALRNIGCDFEVVGTSDWDITASIAYDLIHHGAQDISKLDGLNKKEVLELLKPQTMTLSTDGKRPASLQSITSLDIEVLKRLYVAIKRSKNHISITDVRGDDLSSEMNLLTYSFPCQDLSVAHAWHGETGGIRRDAANRSSMLWQVERILKERFDNHNNSMPRFLLMENVPNILAERHRANLQEWLNSLTKMGYHNHIYKLSSNNFGSPQRRTRVYMISVLTNGDKSLEQELESFYLKNDLSRMKPKERKTLKDVLKVDYTNERYYKEAMISQPNDTPSRRAIFNDNVLLYDGKHFSKLVPTLTTKQDRNPNSGVIFFPRTSINKSDFRYLTPRECFLMMGFSEDDYERIDDNNFVARGRNFFSYANMVKLAGNSIVVNVLEDVFRQIIQIDKEILKEE